MASADELRATILGVCDTPKRVDELGTLARQRLSPPVTDSMVHIAVWSLTDAGLLVEHVDVEAQLRYQRRRVVKRTDAGTVDAMT